MEGTGVGGAWPATLGHDSGREEGGKGVGRSVGLIPGRNSARGGPGWPGHGGRRAAGGGERGSGAAKLGGGPDLGGKE